MNQHPRLEVVDGYGWRREYLLEKPIVSIGSGARNDVVLEQTHGEGVAPLHAQLILSTHGQPGAGGSARRLVNVGDSAITLGESGDQTLPPRSATELLDGTVFKLGDFKLVYHDGEVQASGGRGRTARSQHIGLSLSLPRTQLAVYETIQGVVTVRNLGEQGYAQFNLGLEGLDPDCYELEPGPVLPSGAEKEALLRLHHRGAKPLAGDHHIIIRASAPQAYPGDAAQVSQVIHVAPYYHYQLRIFAPGEELPAPRETGPEAARPEAVPEPEAPMPSEGWWAATPEAASPIQEEAPVEASPPPLVMRQPVSEPEAPPPAPTAEPSPAQEIAEEVTPEAERVPPGEAGALEAEAEEKPLPVPSSEARAPDTGAETIPAEEEVEIPGPVETHGPDQGEAAAGLEEAPPPQTERAALQVEVSPSAETEPVEEPAPQELRLGAEPTPGTEEEAPAEPQPPPDRDAVLADEQAWAGVPAEEETRQVLKMKASPPPDREAEERLEPDTDAGPTGAGAASTEDWWASTDEGRE